MTAKPFKARDNAYPGNDEGVTLLSTVGRTFCKILDEVGTMLGKEKKKQGASRVQAKRSGVDHVYNIADEPCEAGGIPLLCDEGLYDRACSFCDSLSPSPSSSSGRVQPCVSRDQ